MPGPTGKYTAGFGERLKQLRHSANWKQEELAARLQVTRQSISGYENDRLFPSRTVIENICDLFHITPWWLLFGVGSPSSESITLSETSEELSSPMYENLTDAQQALIKYIRSDPKVAANIVKLLWDKALES